MKNTEATQTIGTLTSKQGVEYVKKCVVCGATLLVDAATESTKDRHTICGWTDSQFQTVLDRADATIARHAAR